MAGISCVPCAAFQGIIKHLVDEELEFTRKMTGNLGGLSHMLVTVLGRRVGWLTVRVQGVVIRRERLDQISQDSRWLPAEGNKTGNKKSLLQLTQTFEPGVCCELTARREIRRGGSLPGCQWPKQHPDASHYR